MSCRSRLAVTGSQHCATQLPASQRVPDRVACKVPADTEFDGRNSSAGDLSFAVKSLGAGFTSLNSVLNGINKFPNQETNGEGPVTGEEVEFDVMFTTPFLLAPDHYFFVPTV